MEKKTQLQVRVQARGGKYLGDDIGGAWVTVRDSQTGELLAEGATTGDSGQLVSDYVPGASQRPIITPGPEPTISWLVPQSTTACFQAEFRLHHPTLLKIAVFGALGGLQTAHRAVVTQWALPGDELTASIEIAGLILQVMEPSTHLELPSAGSTVPLQAKVAMMCGCPIGEGMPWVPADFDVSAQIRVAGSNEVTQVPLAFAGGTVPGIFEGTYTVTQQGFYSATIQAIQRSTGNTGAGEVTFFNAPPSRV
jgi:hypothetical protein